MLPIVSALNGIGLAMIHRIDLANQADHADAKTFAGTQLVWMTIGVGLFIATLVILRDHRVLQRFTYTCGLAAIVLLLLPMAPVIGKTVNGARIWIHVGSMSFQPGEVAKVLPATSCSTATPWRSPGDASPWSTCHAAATSARSWRCGW